MRLRLLNTGILSVVVAGAALVARGSELPARAGAAVRASLADSIVGVFEGRTPCDALFVEFTGYAGPTCEKMKWRVLLYRDANGHPRRYVFDGTRVTRTGKWLVERGSAVQPDDVVYRLLTDLPVQSIGLLRVDENILLLLDRQGRPMVGDASWSYTLSRTR